MITWNGPIMGYLNSFLASGGGNLNKNFPKIQMPGGLPGGMFKLRFDWYITKRRNGIFEYLAIIKSEIMRLVTLSNVNSETLTLITVNSCVLIYITCCEHMRFPLNKHDFPLSKHMSIFL